jgi:hypothetical protein
MVCQTFTGSMTLVNAITGANVFAGTSVEIKGFSSNLGTSNSESSIDLDLVYNQCTNTGVGDLNVGYPVIFTCNGFIFGGFVDKIEYSESESGVGWKVRITDPRKFLDNVQILLDGYYCPITNFTNFINVQNLLEGTSAGTACAGIVNPEIQLPSITYGCPFYGAGKLGSGRTSYLAALNAVEFGGPPLYTIQGQPIYYDLTPIRNVVADVPWAGSDSPNTTLLQLISSACDEAGYDFVVTLSGNVITFTTINRRTQNSLSGVLPSLISYYKNTTKTLISSSYGNETSYQTTKKVIIGDNIHYLKYGNTYNQTNMIIGYGIDGTPMLANYAQLVNGITINASTLSAILADQGYPYLNAFPTIKEAEILAALGGQSFWLSYCTRNPTSIGAIIGQYVYGSTWINAGTSIAQGLNSLSIVSHNNHEGLILNNGLSQLNNNADAVKIAIMDTVRTWITKWADQYYGRQWMVDIPTPICYSGYVGVGPSVGGNSQSTLVSDEIADAGWTDSFNVLGLMPRSADTTLFETNDGRLKAFVALPTNVFRQIPFNNQYGTFYLDPSKISSEFYVKGSYVYIPADVENKIYYRGPTTIGVVIKTSPIGLSFRPNNLTVAKGLNVLGLLASGGTPSTPPGTGATQVSPHTYNMFNIGAAAGAFTHACIPFKSNMYVYGPWWSASGVEGGTEIVKNSDLNPWTYGSSTIMDNVGFALSTEGVRSQVTSETGSLVVAEAPAYSLGPLVNYAGLVLGSVVVNFGSSGITTTYNFQTFSQKFGNYAKNLSDRIKQTASLKREIYDVIRSNRQKNLSELNSTRTKVFNARITAASVSNTVVTTSASSTPSQTEGSTPVKYLIGSYPYNPSTSFPPIGISGGGSSGPAVQEKLSCNEIDSPPSASYSSSSIGSPVTTKVAGSVGLDKVYSGIHYADKNNYISYAITSLDALLSPVSLAGSGGLSKFAQSCYNSPTYFPNKPRPVMPPVLTDIGIVGGMVINGYFLNPMASTAILGGWDTRSNGSVAGFSLQTVAYGNDPTKLFSDSFNDLKQNATDFRFNALKGPLVLQAWGYDTEGKPIPNAVDGPEDCASGYFEKTGLQDKFMPNWQSDPRVWPVGPIDLRWDRDRGVWVSPPSEKLVIAQLIADLDNYGAAQAVLLNPNSGGGNFYQDHDVYGPQGEHITGDILGAKILVTDFLGRKLCKGTVIYAYHYGGGRYLALETSIVGDGACDLCDSGTSPSSDSESSSSASDATSDSASSESSSADNTSESSSADNTSESSSADNTSESSSADNTSASSSGYDCNACGLLDCLESINNGPISNVSGVLGVANGCLTIYPLVACGT